MYMIYSKNRKDDKYEETLADKVFNSYSSALKTVRMDALNKTKEYLSEDKDVICDMTPTPESDARVKYASRPEIEHEFRVMELVRKPYDPKNMA